MRCSGAQEAWYVVLPSSLFRLGDWSTGGQEVGRAVGKSQGQEMGVLRFLLWGTEIQPEAHSWRLGDWIPSPTS